MKYVNKVKILHISNVYLYQIYFTNDFFSCYSNEVYKLGICILILLLMFIKTVKTIEYNTSINS